MKFEVTFGGGAVRRELGMVYMCVAVVYMRVCCHVYACCGYVYVLILSLYM